MAVINTFIGHVIKPSDVAHVRELDRVRRAEGSASSIITTIYAEVRGDASACGAMPPLVSVYYVYYSTTRLARGSLLIHRRSIIIIIILLPVILLPVL